MKIRHSFMATLGHTVTATVMNGPTRSQLTKKNEKFIDAPGPNSCDAPAGGPHHTKLPAINKFKKIF
jgi:hypothetical protein